MLQKHYENIKIFDSLLLSAVTIQVSSQVTKGDAGRSARPGPQLQSSQLAFMARLLVSADLTADEIPATGGHRRFVLRQGTSSLASHQANILGREEKTNSACRSEDMES